MKLLAIVLTVLLLACSGGNTEDHYKNQFLSPTIPGSQPLKYLPKLLQKDKIIHKGIFSPELNEFYFTVSNKDFTDFDIKAIHKIEAEWSLPQEAFFNSEFDDHGMSFSPDGTYLYLSSTRPVDQAGIPETWHIWRSKKTDERWSPLEFVDIPNMREKLVSHPSITNAGKLAFHASELDYSNMRIYASDFVDGEFQDASILFDSPQDQCTPLISPDGKYIIYGQVAEHSIDLMISHQDADGKWHEPKALMRNDLNMNCQGNPYITPDEKFLFFTSSELLENDEVGNWYINWVDIESLIN
ncbi:MAG: TolB family protein [Bacteroidia bacterium]